MILFEISRRSGDVIMSEVWPESNKQPRKRSSATESKGKNRPLDGYFDLIPVWRGKILMFIDFKSVVSYITPQGSYKTNQNGHSKHQTVTSKKSKEKTFKSRKKSAVNFKRCRMAPCWWGKPFSIKGVQSISYYVVVANDRGVGSNWFHLPPLPRYWEGRLELQRVEVTDSTAMVGFCGIKQISTSKYQWPFLIDVLVYIMGRDGRRHCRREHEIAGLIHEFFRACRNDILKIPLW